MNIFQFLGLPANHRSEEKVTHKVKNHHEVPESKITWPRLVQNKYDGVHCIVVVHGEAVGLFSRTGNMFTNVSFLIDQLDAELDNGVYSGELVNELLSLEELSGAVNPNRTKPLDDNAATKIKKSWLALFDYFSVEEFIAGKSKLSYNARLNELRTRSSSVCVCHTTEVHNETELLKVAKWHTDQGYEGVVSKDPAFIWTAGKKDESMTKIVRGVDYDLEVIGVEEGKGKRAGMVANLIVRWRPYGKADADSVSLPVDGRFTDEQRLAWWDCPASIIGRVVHVHALQLGSKGSLRLAKGHEVRIDKSVADL